MIKGRKISVIIPALNEEESLPGLLAAIPREVDSVLVVDNGSTDDTFAVAGRGYHPRARTLSEMRRGYGWACLAGMRELKEEDIVVFLDADFSDDPRNLPLLVEGIVAGEADMVLANRFTSNLERGAMSPAQRFGNQLAVWLMKLFFDVRYQDLGPFRAIGRRALESLEMMDKNYGWTIEMQIKAHLRGLRVKEIDLPYRKRKLGTSKVGSNLSGIVKAGVKILTTIALMRIKAWMGKL